MATFRHPTALPPEALARIAHRLKAMADPTRLHILQLLAPGELCVGDLVSQLGCTQANVSKHLGVLRAAGLVRPRRDGMNVYYAVEEPAALEVCQLMCGCVEREATRAMAEVRRPPALRMDRAERTRAGRGTRPARHTY
jgi:ArsR family transcriptional regulator